jgi:hypothetical protein
VAQNCLAGETLHSLAHRHDLSRNLIRIWVQKFEGGAFDDEAVAANTIEAYEARIATLERLVGRQALEFEFLHPDVGPPSTSPSRNVSCYPSLDRGAGPIPGRAGQGGPWAADRFRSANGGV